MRNKETARTLFISVLFACFYMLTLSACAGASEPLRTRPRVIPSEEMAASTSAPSPEEDEVVATAPRVSGPIARVELDRVLDHGLGYFLQDVVTEPHLNEGRFVGFRIVEMRRDSHLSGTGLQSGDTVVRVNGHSIERPEQAIQIWNGLRVASELRIEYLREGEPAQLRYAIRD